MNNRGLDGLFRKRLEGYQEKPSDAAWEKLDNRLKSRKNKVWWQFAKVAAVLTLIACSVYLFNLWSQTGVSNQAISEITPENNEEKQPAPQQIEELVAESATPISNNEKKIEKQSEKATPVENKQAPIATPSSPTTEEDHVSPSKETQIELMQASQTKILADKSYNQDYIPKEQPPQNDPEIPAQEQEDINTLADPVKTKITITYKKSPAPPEPTLALIDEPVEKTRGVKRLWRKAQNIRNTDLSLARLRAAKDQLLVFDKKSKAKEKSN